MKENNDFLFLFHCTKMGLPTRVKVTLKDYRIKYSRWSVVHTHRKKIIENTNTHTSPRAEKAVPVIVVGCNSEYAIPVLHTLKSHSRAYLSTVKLQMQRLNCHSQLISNSVQFLDKTHFASYWFGLEHAYYVFGDCHTRDVPSLFAVWKEINVKKEFQCWLSCMGSTDSQIDFIHEISILHCAFCVCSSHLSDETKWIVHWTSPFFRCSEWFTISLELEMLTQRD